VKVSGHEFRGQQRYAAIFEQGPALPWVARHGLDGGEYQATVTDLYYQAYEPKFVNAFATAGGPRFSTVWENRTFSGADLAHIDNTVNAAMSKAGTTGVSLAISQHGRLVFAKSYGYADDVNKTPLHTTHRLRQASVSKPFTAVEVMRLVEAGRIKLSDQVFGANGLLGEAYGKENTYADSRVLNITVQQLLEHTAGGWDNDAKDGTGDPMFMETGKSQADLIKWILQNIKLEHAPGTRYQYSNVGYAILGRIIEKVTGKSYADAMRDDLFAPSGAGSFAIAGDTLADRLPGEVVYHHAGNQTDAYGMKVARMDAHGGWVASPIDVVRATLRADGSATVPDVLGADTVNTMSTVGTATQNDGTPSNYAKGWLINASGPNWFHDGYLWGTRSILVRRASGIVFSAAANSTNADDKTDINLDQMMIDVVDGVKAWPAHNLF
jgi:CubicO group peptidase (beta-lactamase class C family)